MGESGALVHATLLTILIGQVSADTVSPLFLQYCDQPSQRHVSADFETLSVLRSPNNTQGYKARRCNWTLETDEENYCFRLTLFQNNLVNSSFEIKNEIGRTLYSWNHLNNTVATKRKKRESMSGNVLVDAGFRPYYENGRKFCGERRIFIIFSSNNTDVHGQRLVLVRYNAVPIARYRTERVPSSTQGSTTPKSGSGQNNSNNKASGPNVVVIAVGVFVPLITIAVVICLVYVWYRRRYPVRMVFGKEFAIFSNPSYTKRSSTLTLVRDPNDVDFERDIENGVRLTGVYYNRGLDVSDETQFQPTEVHSTMLRSMSDETKTFDESPRLKERKPDPSVSPRGFSLVVENRNVSKDSLAPSTSQDGEQEDKQVPPESKKVETKVKDIKDVEGERKRNSEYVRQDLVAPASNQSNQKERSEGVDEDEQHDSDEDDKDQGIIIGKTDDYDDESDEDGEILGKKDDSRKESVQSSKKEGEERLENGSDMSCSAKEDNDSDRESDQSTGEYVITTPEDERIDKIEEEDDKEDINEDGHGRVHVTINDLSPKLLERSRSSSMNTEEGDLESNVDVDEDDVESSGAPTENMEDGRTEVTASGHDDVSVERVEESGDSFEFVKDETFELVDKVPNEKRFSPQIENLDRDRESTAETENKSTGSNATMDKEHPTFSESHGSPDRQTRDRESPVSIKSSESSESISSVETPEFKINPRPTRFSPPPVRAAPPPLPSSPPPVPISQPEVPVPSDLSPTTPPIPSSQPPLQSDRPPPSPPTISATPSLRHSAPPKLPSTSPPPPPPSYLLTYSPAPYKPISQYIPDSSASPPIGSSPSDSPLLSRAPPLPNAPPPVDDLPPMPKSPPPMGDFRSELAETAEVTYQLPSDEEVFLDMKSPEIRSDTYLPFHKHSASSSPSRGEPASFSFSASDLETSKSPRSVNSSFSVINDSAGGKSPLRLNLRPAERSLSHDSGSSFEIVDRETFPQTSSGESSDQDDTGGDKPPTLQGRRESITLDNPTYASPSYNFRFQLSTEEKSENPEGGKFGRRKSITLDNPTYDAAGEPSKVGKDDGLDRYHSIEATHIAEEDAADDSEPEVPKKKVLKVNLIPDSSDDEDFDADHASVHSGMSSASSMDSDVSDVGTTQAYILNDDDSS